MSQHFDSLTQGSADKWSGYMSSLYFSRQPPSTGTLDFAQLEQRAREKLKGREDAFIYVFGSAGTGSTCTANVKEFSKWKIVPRVLRDTTVRNIETTIFGVKYRAPLFLAPIGVQGIVHPDAELASAAAAEKTGVGIIVSTAATRCIEAVAQANGSGHRWYQMYWPKTPEVTLSLLSRAKANGYSALVVTLDTMHLGWRPLDLDTSYVPFLYGVGSQTGLTDPVFMARHGLKPHAFDKTPDFPYDPAHFDALAKSGDEQTLSMMKIGAAWISETTGGTFRTWDDLKFVRKNWEGPLVLKGIMCAEDAELAIDAGADGIVVSNHGGRQVDGALPSLYALREIRKSAKVRQAQADGKFTIFFDSGVRTGSDIFKAIALGAQAVLYGRPYIYGLTIAGQDGVESVVRGVLADFEITLGLAGYKSLEEIWGKGEEVLVKLE